MICYLFSVIFVILLLISNPTVSYAWYSNEHQDNLERFITDHERLDKTVLQKYAVISDRSDVIAEVTDVKGEKKQIGLFEIKALHGRDNYVANTKFLYDVASKISKVNVKEAIEQTEYKGSKERTSKIKTIYQEMVVCSEYDTIVSAIMAVDQIATTKKEKENAILGLAIHLAGDVFAHQTIVPEDFSKHAEAGHFKDYEEVKQVVKANRLRFAEFKRYLISKNEMQAKFHSNVRDPYEDNVKFYPSRYYLGALFTEEKMLKAYQNKEPFQPLFFVPALYATKEEEAKQFKLKLYNVSEYIKEVDVTSYNQYSEKQWSRVSENF